MKQLLLIISLISFSFSISSFELTHSINAEGRSVIETSDGGYIVAGNVDGNEATLIKIDNGGNISWDFEYAGLGHGAYASSVKQTGDGGYIVIGYQQSNGDMDSDNTFYGYVPWLLKVNNEGYPTFQKFFDLNIENDSQGGGYGYDIDIAQDGGYILFCQTDANTNSSTDVYLIKTNSLGEEEWRESYRINDADTYVSSGFTTSDGGYIFAGTAPYTNDAGYICKTDSQGLISWSNTNYSRRITSVSETSDVGYIFSSYTGGDGGDYRLVKLDAAGSQEWSETYDMGSLSTNAIALSVDQAPDGGYIATGYNSYLNSDQQYDISLLKVNSDGTYNWDTSFPRGEEDNVWGWGQSVAAASDGGYVITGFSEAGPSNFSNGKLIIIKADESGNVVDCGEGWDTCGECGGSGVDEYGCCPNNPPDCSGVCGGSLDTDVCGVCSGNGNTCCDNACTGETPDCDGSGTCYCSAGLDCAGTCDGTAADDVCGVCSGNGSTCCDNACSGETPECDGDGICYCDAQLDCLGICGGGAVIDECGDCNGGNADMDCGGVCGGDAYVDNCGQCMCGPNENPDLSECDDDDECEQGCNGGWYSDLDDLPIIDDCGDCDGGNAGMDVCGICSGDGNTCCDNACAGETPDCDGNGTCYCEMGLDCAGVCGGDADYSGCDWECNSIAEFDCDGICGGDAEFSGCDGECNSTAVYDKCGNCGGNGPFLQCQDGSYVCSLMDCPNPSVNATSFEFTHSINAKGHSIVQTSDGGYIVAGNVDGNEATLIKIDNGGNISWDFTYSGLGHGAYASSVKQTGDG